MLVWRKGLTVHKDPDDIIDIVLDYSNWLTGSNTVDGTSTSTAETGLTVDSTSTTTTTVTSRISSGTAGATYDLNFNMVDSDGQELNRTVKIKVSDH